MVLKKHMHPYPNPIVQCIKTVDSKIFDAFPETKVMIEEFVSANLINLNSERMAQHIRHHIIPAIHAIHIADAEETGTEPWSREELMRSFNLTNVGVQTAWRWLKRLGYTYQENKKCYFSDKHEDPRNIAACLVYIKKYLKLEIRAHHWVQTTEEKAIELEGNKI